MVPDPTATSASAAAHARRSVATVARVRVRLRVRARPARSSPSETARARRDAPSTARVAGSLTTASRRPSPSGATRSASMSCEAALDAHVLDRHADRRAAVRVAIVAAQQRSSASALGAVTFIRSAMAAASRSCRHLGRLVAGLENVLDLAAERSLGGRERAVEHRRSDREGIDAGFGERVDPLRRIHAAGDDQLLSPAALRAPPGRGRAGRPRSPGTREGPRRRSPSRARAGNGRRRAPPSRPSRVGWPTGLPGNGK